MYTTTANISLIFKHDKPKKELLVEEEGGTHAIALKVSCSADLCVIMSERRGCQSGIGWAAGLARSIVMFG